MNKDKRATAGFKFKITAKGNEPLTIHEMDLKQVCWDYIFELERQNPQTVEDFGTCDFLDSLMQSYFTWKMITKELTADLTNEMAQIEEFITKYLRRFFTAIHLEELNNLPPAFQFEDW